MTMNERTALYWYYRKVIQEAAKNNKIGWRPHMLGMLSAVAKSTHYTAAKKGIHLMEFTKAMEDLQKEDIIK